MMALLQATRLHLQAGLSSGTIAWKGSAWLRAEMVQLGGREEGSVTHSDRLEGEDGPLGQALDSTGESVFANGRDGIVRDQEPVDLGEGAVMSAEDENARTREGRLTSSRNHRCCHSGSQGSQRGPAQRGTTGCRGSSGYRPSTEHERSGWGQRRRLCVSYDPGARLGVRSRVYMR